MNRQTNLGMMRNPEYDTYLEERTRWEEFYYRPVFDSVVMYRIEPDIDAGNAGNASVVLYLCARDPLFVPLRCVRRRTEQLLK